MAAGKLALLLIAGGLAGAAFAGLTTGTMRPYRDHAASELRPPATSREEAETAYAGPPAHQSWLDEGLSVLESPAWPFGHAPGNEDAGTPYPDAYGYAPDDDPRAVYENGRWDHDDGYAYGRQDDAAPGLSADEQAGPAPGQADAASDAARNAADAAQDVIAAERAN